MGARPAGSRAAALTPGRGGCGHRGGNGGREMPGSNSPRPTAGSWPEAGGGHPTHLMGPWLEAPRLGSWAPRTTEVKREAVDLPETHLREEPVVITV